MLHKNFTGTCLCKFFIYESNGGGGIRNPKGVVTHSEQVTDKTSTEPLQNGAKGTFTECHSEQHKTDSQQDCDNNLHQKCAKSVHMDKSTTPLPDDLETVVKSWPELPGHIKAAIKALIQTQNKP